MSGISENSQRTDHHRQRAQAQRGLPGEERDDQTAYRDSYENDIKRSMRVEERGLEEVELVGLVRVIVPRVGQQDRWQKTKAGG